MSTFSEIDRVWSASLQRDIHALQDRGPRLDCRVDEVGKRFGGTDHRIHFERGESGADVGRCQRLGTIGWLELPWINGPTRRRAACATSSGVLQGGDLKVKHFLPHIEIQSRRIRARGGDAEKINTALR